MLDFKDIKINKRFLKELRRQGIRIELHGNGFIKIPLDPTTRIHVFDPRLKRYAQKVRTDIHNHRFSFYSTIITGCLEHTSYSVIPTIEKDGKGYTYRMYSPDGDGKLSIANLLNYKLKETSVMYLKKGSSYNLPYGVFHSVDSDEFTVTLMEKRSVMGYMKPMVACEIQNVPDNDFESPVDDSFLWDFVIDNFPSKV